MKRFIIYVKREPNGRIILDCYPEVLHHWSAGMADHNHAQQGFKGRFLAEAYWESDAIGQAYHSFRALEEGRSPDLELYVL